MLFDLIASFIKAVLVFAVVMSFVPFLIWLERKLVAWMQQRIGPNRTGPFGLLQPIADAVKLIIKENIFPSGVEKITYFLAPMMSMIPALAAFAVIPFGSPVRIMGRTVNLQVADVTSAFCTSSRCRRWRCTARCWRGGARTTSIRCSGGCAQARR